MTSTRVTNRSRVLRVLNASPQWMTARDVAQLAQLTYEQTLYALNALLNTGRASRSGKKSTARWGNRSMSADNNSSTANALATLHKLFPVANRHHP